MRPIISYDDITTPHPAVPPPPPTSKHQANLSNPQPPAKKRKASPRERQGGASNGRAGQPVQHWDDPGNQGMPMSYDDAPKQAAEGGEEEEDVYSFYSVSSSLPHGTERRARGSERVINRESRSARLVG